MCCEKPLWDRAASPLCLCHLKIDSSQEQLFVQYSELKLSERLCSQDLVKVISLPRMHSVTTFTQVKSKLIKKLKCFFLFIYFFLFSRFRHLGPSCSLCAQDSEAVASYSSWPEILMTDLQVIWK